ncbi:MAG: CBS domain-containing protein [Chloroflexi bacterium]|nr:CBS domain-containing protein [Chloroflexota bacterium]
MLIKDIMTTNVVTAPSTMLVSDAKKLMKEHNFRRLPVVDDGKLLGIVSEGRLERVAPKTTTPLLWQITYLVSHTTVKDVLEKNVVTIAPEATVEQGVALAQQKKVGALIVVKDDAIVGIVTTNDFFYKIVNPTLGVGEAGTRLLVHGGGSGKAAQAIIGKIDSLGIAIKIIWTLRSPDGGQDVIIQMDTEDAGRVIKELKKLGYSAEIRAR